MFWDFRKLWMNGIPILRKLLLTCPYPYHNCSKQDPKFVVRTRLKTKTNGLGRSWPKYDLDWFKPDQGPNGSVRTFFQPVPNQAQTRPKTVLIGYPKPAPLSGSHTCPKVSRKPVRTLILTCPSQNWPHQNQIQIKKRPKPDPYVTRTGKNHWLMTHNFNDDLESDGLSNNAKRFLSMKLTIMIFVLIQWRLKKTFEKILIIE